MDPVAIVGIGCRFPGADTLDQFWAMLSEGRETISTYPGARFPFVDAVYGGSFGKRVATPRGGFLQGIDRFDASFFGISPREAVLLDPQQRLLLELAWEALEDAGLTRDVVAGPGTGIFVGLWTSDYQDCVNETSPDVDLYATTGTGRYSASGRLAFALDARGPNLTLDTACSSSLVAIHLACQSLNAGECDLALAGAANLILRPEITVAYSAARMLSPDGSCKFGDAGANGYVRCEGAGVLALKRLDAAVADGDPIHAVIRGTAVNNDGRGSGLLVAPSAEGQRVVFETALRRAGLSPADLDYVEAHGTGTGRGDPVELEAIGRVLEQAPRGEPCLVGSVKTNIGHSEAAAGIAGIVKTVLAMRHRTIPKSLHLETPNPDIPWDAYPLRIATRSTPWPDRGAPMRAGVCGFGITGTNAHVVLEEAPRAERPAPAPAVRPHLFALSAQGPAALAAMARSWLERLLEMPSWPPSLSDLAYTSLRRRSPLDDRLTIVAGDRAELIVTLGEIVAGSESDGAVRSVRPPTPVSGTVFVFPGQGGQWLGMGRQLLEREPVFRAALERADAAVRAEAGFSVRDKLTVASADSDWETIDVIQPTLFAFMVALAELWRSLGVEPAAVVGHSMGEVAAAVVAGALSLEDGARVVSQRSRLMKRVRGLGAMAVVEEPRARVEARLTGVDGVWIAAVNGASSTVVSGDVAAIDGLLAALERDEVFAKRIRVDVASHSGHMEPLQGELEVALAGIRPRPTTIPFYSTVTGSIRDGASLDARYWASNLRCPVLFHDAMSRLLEAEFGAFLEINAHPVLTHSMAETVRQAGRAAVVTGSLRRERDESRELAIATAALHGGGAPVDLARWYPDGAVVPLPGYPWQRERFWFEAAPGSGSVRSLPAAQTSPADRSLFHESWVDVGTGSPPAGRRTWLVLADDARGVALGEHIAASGDRCLLVAPGPAFRRIDADRFVVDPVDPASWAELAKATGDRIGGVVHGWSLRDVGSGLTATELLAEQRVGAVAVVAMIRGMADACASLPAGLWLVTRGVQQVGPTDPVVPVHGGLIGLGRCIAIEHPELRCVNVDLDLEPGAEAVRRAADVIRGGTGEQQLTIRGARVAALRYRLAPALASGGPSIRGDATYLITGGLGGLGELVSRWLAGQGARRIALAGRRPAGPDALRWIGELDAAGVAMDVIGVDVSDAGQVERLIDRAGSDAAPLRGVFHLAGIQRHGAVLETDEAAFADGFTAKAIGAWNVVRAVEDRALDFVVLFSSLMAVLPPPRSATYSAANSFLDALARAGSRQQGRIRSIQFGMWRDLGMMKDAAARDAQQLYESQGVLPLDPALGTILLERSLGGSAPVSLAAAFDWGRFGMAGTADAWLEPFEGFVARAADNAEGSGSVGMPFEGVPAGAERRAAVEQLVRSELAAVLKLSPERIELEKPMGLLGLDSLMGLELVRRLSGLLGIKVAATAAFNYPTVRKLATLIESRFAPPSGAGAAPVPAGDGPVAAVSGPAVTAMSEEDALQALLSTRGGRR